MWHSRGQWMGLWLSSAMLVAVKVIESKWLWMGTKSQVTLIAEALHQRVLGHRAHGVDREHWRHGFRCSAVAMTTSVAYDHGRIDRAMTRRSAHGSTRSDGSWFNNGRWLVAAMMTSRPNAATCKTSGAGVDDTVAVPCRPKRRTVTARPPDHLRCVGKSAGETDSNVE